ncbi:Protein roadkill [Fusarium oxysporum f. sp. cubense race 1]|uniref:Protein roadkill n=1 Tax=Fusarium oxysporum f. sp. cubense (strain race 1) TaxID=1229664 RepID=N4UQU6_FUSC1|nr:Protein roadkill [Fusarium oxysporum f. sp. cubense race 1]
MTPQGLEEFLSSLKEYYNKDALSDITITCDGQEFKAHRVIISAHSKCFAKALNGDWKESSERQIDIKDFDASVVEAMLRFMYSFDYSNIYGTSTMVFDAQMYQIADKYDIPALKAQSKNKFDVAVTTGWSMDDFPLAITVVYESTPPEDRGLRDLVVQTARKNIDKLLGHDGFCELIRKTPDFAADLIPFLCVKPSKSMHRYECPSCENQFQGEFSGRNYYCPCCSRQRSDWNSHQIND